MNSATGFSGLLFSCWVKFFKTDNSLQSKCFVSQELSSENVNSLLSDRRIHCNALKTKSVNICSWRFPARPYHGNPNLAWPDEKSLKFLAEKNKQERESSDQGRLGSQTRRARYPATCELTRSSWTGRPMGARQTRWLDQWEASVGDPVSLL